MRTAAVAVLLGLPVLIALCAVLGLRSAPFAAFALFAWCLFGAVPAVLVGCALLLQRHHRRVALGCVIVAAMILIVAVDAFVVEPRWLEVTTVQWSSARASRPLRIAVMADIQTDDAGLWEGRACHAVMAAHPDLILLTGDHIQAAKRQRYLEQQRILSETIADEGLDAPLGAFAVAGNVDWPGLWTRVFAGTAVQPVTETTRFDLGPCVLTCLSRDASFDVSTHVAPADKLHIVLGHCPNFALGRVDADLLVAGHTHGGQVRLPLVGPLLTFSAVPRRWAHGATEIAPGKLLVVSRGIGMERGKAPRLRLLCRPELVLVEVKPAIGTSGTGTDGG